MKPTFWQPVSKGKLVLHPRPSARRMQELAADGATDIVTLLSEREGAADVGALAAQQGLGWHWLPMEDGRPPGAEKSRQILAGILEISALLERGAHVVLHCAAGQHRTGMIAYAVLLLHHPPGEALNVLKKLRPITHEQVGAHRLRWAHRWIETLRQLPPESLSALATLPTPGLPAQPREIVWSPSDLAHAEALAAELRARTGQVWEALSAEPGFADIPAREQRKRFAAAVRDWELANLAFRALDGALTAEQVCKNFRTPERLRRAKGVS